MVAEHGETAAISAVNRIRSGGVAGFFCKEEFEVVVDPNAAPTRSTVPVLRDEPDPVEEAPPARLAYRPQDEDPEERPSEVSNEVPDDVPLADRLEVPRPAVAEAPAERPPAVGDEGPAFAAPTPPSGDRFLALLERKLDETSSTEAARSLRRLDATRPGRPVERARREAARPDPAPVAPAPAPALEPGELESVTSDADATTGDGPTGSRSVFGDLETLAPFWRQLRHAREELASFLPSDAPVTAVVGPLPLATSVVRRLRSGGPLASADVIVLTDRAGIVSEPSWDLVRHANRLVEAVADRVDQSTAGRSAEPTPLVVVIDVPAELPHWVPTLQHRLRAAGVGLFRYPVAGQPTAVDLERFRQGGDVPYAVDLVSRVEPEVVLGLLADRHPVVSVAGSDLSPELLVALRRHGSAPLALSSIDG